MYAIEFETDIKDRFIELKDYERLINKHARVIVLIDEDKPNQEDFIDRVIKNPKHLNEKFLTRDEANAR